MEIEYPNYIVWRRKNSKDPLEFMSGSVTKRITSSLPRLNACQIDVRIEPLDAAFFSWFSPLYMEIVGNKRNANVHDVYTATLGKSDAAAPYYALTLTEQGVPLGGTIFSMRAKKLSFAYRAFRDTWMRADIPASPSLIGEYFVSKYASESEVPYTSHGRDRNPFGINSAIGLAIFKLSIGCYPKLHGTFSIERLSTETLEDDVLILEKPQEGRRIRNAHLFTLHAHEEKYLQATKYPELLSVTVHYRN